MTEPSLEGLELSKLREKDLFGEFMIAAWGTVELFVDIFVFDSYGITYEDPRAELLGNITFQRKLDHLKSINYLSSDDYGKIRRLQLHRNVLFHYADGKFAYMLADPEKRRKAYDDGDNAVNTCLSVFLRKHPEADGQFKTR